MIANVHALLVFLLLTLVEFAAVVATRTESSRKALHIPLSGQGSAQPLVVHFVRHGEIYNPNKIVYGRLPFFHLSEKGFQEAADGANVLRAAIDAARQETGISSVSSVFHSPMLRTRETAEGLTAFTNLSALLVEEPALIEVNVPYNGAPLSVAKALKFDLYRHGKENEGFENFQDVLHRVVQFVNLLRTSPANGNSQAVAVTHGDIALTARLWASKGLTALQAGGPGKPEFDESMIPYPGHVSITSLIFDCEAHCEFPKWTNNATIKAKNI